MEVIDNIQQYKLYIEAILVAPGCWEFVQKDRSTELFPEFDFHIPVFLTREYEVFEYVQIDKEEEIETIVRQEINPFFMELSFFDSIEKNKALEGSDLTNKMIDYIRIVRPEFLDLSNTEITLWFDQIGVNELPWNKGTTTEITKDDIDRADLVVSHIVSKANYFNIDINK